MSTRRTVAARGWAVIDDSGIRLDTVYETRRGAIVNWLAVGGRTILDIDSDGEIETWWQERRGTAVVAEVNVTATVVEAPGEQKQ